jgi:hypothetical protein
MKKTFSLLIFIFSITNSFAKYIDLNTIPQYDCDHKKEQVFTSKRFLFVIPDKADSVLSERMRVYSSWYQDTICVKKESELLKNDYHKHLWIIGKINGFKEWARFGLPIVKIDNGFTFNKIEYTGTLDGISFVDTNRIAYVGNDNNCLFGIREPSYSNGFDFTITQDLRKTIFGNFICGYDSVFQSDLQLIRKNNYEYYPSEFMDYYVSYKLDNIDIDEIKQSLKQFCQDFCHFYHLPVPKEKIKAFFHFDQLEILMVSGYWDRCGGDIGGLAPKGEIHMKGISPDLISHEFGHKIYESHFGSSDDKPGFLSEGVVRYYFSKNDKKQYRGDLNIALKNIDNIDYLSKFDERTKFDFHNDYPVSGVFVKYILDNYGVDILNKYYAQNEFVHRTQFVFHKSIEEFIADYKIWLLN